MSFQYQQIDRISDFDTAIAVLEDEYIPALLEVFGASLEGQALLDTKPDVQQSLGNWVSNLVYFAYAHLGITLPKMNSKHVKIMLEELFPKKLALRDPAEAETAIPELIAFWQFMQREYQHRHSKKILAFLADIEDKFVDIMNDLRNFGMAKSFMMAGLEAGFDTTNPAELAAFQEHYNRQLAETKTPPPGFPAIFSPPSSSHQPSSDPLTMPLPAGVPPEFVALLAQQIGMGLVPGLEHLPTDRAQLIDALAHHLAETEGRVLDDEGDEEEWDERRAYRELQAELLGRSHPEPIELTEAEIALLKDLTLTETTPGTIVKDFDTLLAAIGDRGLPVSDKSQLFPMKVLGDLNAQMSQPIAIALKRPQHKSFPNLYGLYLVLRATNIATVVPAGKKFQLQLQPDILASWQQLTPTEKYFTLLEAWLVRTHEDLTGVRRGILTPGIQFVQTWPQLHKRKRTFANYSEQQDLNYWPGLLNLALAQMFGLMDVTAIKPSEGGGWRVKKIKPLPLGDAITKVVANAYFTQNFFGDSLEDASHPWGDLQPYFQPYCPDWKNNLAALPLPPYQEGTYIFKVSLGDIWRRLSVSSASTLDDLGHLIRRSVNFDSDHLDCFYYQDSTGRTIEVFHPYCEMAAGKDTSEVRVGDLPLQPGMTLTYLFDFGDRWQFQLRLEAIAPGKPKRGSNKILERHGKAPEQYPNGW